jgi:hypothetical protein
VNNPIKETFLGLQGYRVLVPELCRGVVADNASHVAMLQVQLPACLSVQSISKTCSPETL